jgi:hypothetical protein
MHRIRQTTLPLVAVAGLFLSAGAAQAQVCGSPTTTILYAGQTMNAGTVTVYNDGTNIYVQYDLASPWIMSDAHVSIAGTLSGIPQTKTGNPIPGRFAYSATFDPEVTSYAFVIPMAGNYVSGDALFVAAHAIVHAPKGAGGTQTGWGFGPGFAGANWATYIGYTVQPCGGGGHTTD